MRVGSSPTLRTRFIFRRAENNKYILTKLCYNDSMKPQTTLIAQVALAEDISVNAEGLDQEVLVEAVNVTEFSEPVDGDELLLQLANEGLV